MSLRHLALAVLFCFAAASGQASADVGSLVDVALTGTASDPAVNDGNAATTTCAPGPVTVDLGRARSLAGFGVSLAGSASTARVTIEAGGRRIVATVPVGTPAWLARPTLARTVRLSTNGACVAELRAFAMPAQPQIVGHDLSFAVQEAAVGATY